MFTVQVSMENIGEFPEFTKAFKLFWEKIMEQLVSGGGTSYQWLETCNFITYEGPGRRLPMDFYDARDFAYEIGLLAGEPGQIQEIEEPSESTISVAFEKVALKYQQGQLQEVVQILAKAEAIL